MGWLLETVNDKDIVAFGESADDQVRALTAPGINGPRVPGADDGDTHEDSTLLPAAMYNQSIGLRKAYV